MQYMLAGLCAPTVLVLHGCTKVEPVKPQQKDERPELEKLGNFITLI